MSSQFSKIIGTKRIDDKDIYYPLFFDLKIDRHKTELKNLLTQNPHIVVLDEIDGQLEELIKLRYPKEKLSKDELNLRIEVHLNKVAKEEYGMWVYYPWLSKLVHLLNEEEFVEVRTNRNQYKITPEEEAILSTKKIGIIGLSVGKAIAMTIATERICGELVLADFDVIELSNLNRIQTGVQNFGIKKTVVVAREIAEIDPYLKVTCYHEGLTEENIDHFFTKDGKLDICIEVCDGLLQKIQARQKAKELGVAVVMDTNDRGMIDIERFDIDPLRPIFHGLLNNLDIGKLSTATTNEEKLPFVNSIIGFNSMSKRLKKSMKEIGKTITTWPQLASSVTLGGGITCHICRKILINESNVSGRFFIDLDEIIR